jgi:hypothetical protein
MAEGNRAEGNTAESTGSSDEAVGRPGPWKEGRYQQRDKPVDKSVRTPPGTSAGPDAPASTPVTQKDYELPD